MSAPKPAPSRARRWWTRTWKIAVAVYGGYLVLLHLFINSPVLPWLIQQPDSVTIHWDWAFSPVPGWAYVRNFYLTVEDPNIQFGLRIDQVSFWCAVPELLHKEFHATHVNGSGISFRMRGKRTPEEAAAEPERMAALPVIAGFPDAIAKPPSGPPDNTPPDPKSIWTVHIEDVTALAREFWVEGLRYDGPARAGGRFTLQPQIHANVNAYLKILGGDLTYGTQRVGSSLEGGATYVLDDFDIITDKGLAPLRSMHANLSLDGELQNARFLNPVLHRTPAPAFASSPGHFELIAKFEKGRIASGSSFRLRASDWQLAKGVYRSSGNYAQLDASVDGNDPAAALTATVSLGSYEIDIPEREREILEGEGLIVRLTSQRLDVLDKPLDDLGFEISVDRARVPDLRIINDFLPTSKLWEVLSGSGDLTGAFTSPANAAGHGNFHLAAHDAAMRFRSLRLGGELTFDGQLAGVASSSKEVGLLGRDELEGQGKLLGHIALSSLTDAPGTPIATFEANADLVLHPLLASEIKGADVLHHLSGELKVDGKVPSLAFLNGALEPRGVQIAGGAGALSFDARLTHGILGRASELTFTSKAVAFEGFGVHANADVAVAARVGQLSNTPEVAVDARVRSLTAGPSELPKLVDFRAIHLLAQSPEVDVADLTAVRPEASLSIDRAHIGDLTQLGRWLPKDFILKRGSAEASLEARLPPEGEGSGKVQLRVDDVAGRWKELSATAQLALQTTVTGLAEAPWKPDVLGRSHLAAAVDLEGTTHLMADTAARGTARVSFRGAGEVSRVKTFTPQAVLQATDGQAAIEGQVYGLADVNRWLKGTPLQLRGGSAQVNATLVAKAGKIVDGTRAHVQSQELQLIAGPVCFDGPLEAAAAIGPPGPLRVTLDVSSPGIAIQSRFLDQTYAQGAQIAVTAHSSSLDPKTALEAATIDAQVTGMSVPHLEKIAGLVPPLKGLVVSAGNASVDATLHRDASGSATAHLALHAESLAATLADKPVTGDLRIDAHLRGPGQVGSVLPPTLDLQDTHLRLENATFPEDQGYWAQADVRQGTLDLRRRTFSMDVDVSARDALPILHLYGKTLGIPGLLDGVLAFKDLKGSATLLVDRQQLFVPKLELHGDAIGFQGRIRHITDHTYADFLLKLSFLEIGVDVEDKHTGVQLLGAESWYERQLSRELPGAKQAD